MASVHRIFHPLIAMSAMGGAGCEEGGKVGESDSPVESVSRESDAVPHDSDAPVDLDACPSWLGLPGSVNAYSAYPDYLITAQELPFSSLHYSRLQEFESGERGRVSVQTSGGYAITSESRVVFRVADTTWYQCTDGVGYLTGRETEWYLDTFDGSVLEATVDITYDPPIVIIPAVTELGETWEIDSVETMTLHTGEVRTVDLHEVRTIAAFETYPIYVRDNLAMRIDSSTGQRWWYGNGIGLFGTDGVRLDGRSEPGQDGPPPPDLIRDWP